MRHQRKRSKLSRDAAHRTSMLRTMSKQLIEHERIRTTQPKAKALKPEFEKLITLAKRGDLHSRRLALSELHNDKFAVHKLGPRRSDSAEMVFLELV
jgi:large subunit ribosomal protein L17